MSIRRREILRRVMADPRKGRFVTLGEFKGRVPPGGLMNPGLRVGFGKLNLRKIADATLR